MIKQKVWYRVYQESPDGREGSISVWPYWPLVWFVLTKMRKRVLQGGRIAIRDMGYW